MLDVPFTKQFSQAACGAAAFEMVLKFLRSRSTSFSQKTFYNKLAELEPHHSGNYRITTDNIVSSARNRHLKAGWGRVSPKLDQMAQQIDHFLASEKIPLIACQKYLAEQPELGHFRVIVGIEGDQVTLHDPCPETGGKNIQWPLEKLKENWKRTGDNVTGGTAIWLAKHEPQNILGPDMPNPWIYIS